MKLNTFKVGAILLSSIFLVTTSCSNEEFETPENTNLSHLPKDVFNKAKELNINPGDIEFKNIISFDGKSNADYIVVNDMAMTKDRFMKIVADDFLAKQYRTQFLVDTDAFPIVDIIAFTGEGPLGLSQLAQDGLVAAVENWNTVGFTDLQLTLTFTDELTGDFSNFEIFVNTDSTLSGDGEAEFPSEDGRPGSYVRINDRVNANFPNGFEHLMTHEIGHAIGFRHTDWQTRQSCVDEGLEEEPRSEGNAQLIFGTLPSIPGILQQDDSIMNACFNFRTTEGELNFNDRSALRFLYPRYF